MFFKTISCVVVMLAMVYGHVPASKPKAYVLESQQYLEDLVQKKKSKKNVPSLGVLFDAYVDDAKKLLEGLDQQDSCDEQDAKKEEILNQIAHYMEVLQKLLTIMNSNQPEPLEIYCREQRTDNLWGTLCGDRPAKRIPRSDESLKNNGQSLEHTKIRYAHSDEELPAAIGSH